MNDREKQDPAYSLSWFFSLGVSMNFSELDLIIIGAGPAGISMAVEAINAGICNSKILILEKGEAHAWSIQKFYQEKKQVTANFKGQPAVCHGVMCIEDMNKSETLSYFDQAIKKNNIKVHYQEEVLSMSPTEKGFDIETSENSYQTKTCAIAIGIFGKPKKPDLKISSDIKKQVHFDITSYKFNNEKVLVVGGGDSASEYAQFLVENNNSISFSYRRDNFSRMNDINRDSLLALSTNKKVNIIYNSNIKMLEASPDQKVIVTFEEELPPITVDHVIFALGGTTPQNFLKLIGIKFNGEQPILKNGNETTVKGLYLLGDLAAGKKGGSIISAFNSAVGAMKNICQGQLSCHPVATDNIEKPQKVMGIKTFKQK